jgi:hemolysin activation/secretion protein
MMAQTGVSATSKNLANYLLPQQKILRPILSKFFCTTTVFFCQNWTNATMARSLPTNLDRTVAIAPTLAQTGAPTPQIPPGSLEPTRPGLEPLPNLENKPSVPKTPTIEPPAIPSTPQPETELKVKIKRIEILGSTVFSQAELEKAVESFIGKEANFEDLIAIRTAITKLYTDNGYVTSGAFLPYQEIVDGVIKVQVVEGGIEKIELKGFKRLKESYVRSRIEKATKTPIDLRRLEAALQLLQQDPLLEKVDAELSAGTTSGLSVLTLNLQEAKTFNFSVQVDNYNSPSIGEIRGTATIEHNNLLGFGDRFTAEYGLNEGGDNYNFSYAIPLNSTDGRLQVSYEKNHSEIVEDPFAELGINSDSRTFSLSFRQPIIRKPSSELAIAIALDLRESQTFILDDLPFSFSAGPENGKSRVTALRFSQDWVQRDSKTVLAARSQFSFGLNLFDATVNDRAADGRFTSWLGQLQWVQSLGGDIISIARLGAQFTPDSLLAIEQFGIGGFNTVRGYRQNERVGDNGIVGTLEMRFPIINDTDGIGKIELAPFFDFGQVWNEKGDLPSPTTLASLGIGVSWQISPSWFARLDWGIPLSDIKSTENSLQDNGFTFSLRIQL